MNEAVYTVDQLEWDQLVGARRDAERAARAAQVEENNLDTVEEGSEGEESDGEDF